VGLIEEVGLIGVSHIEEVGFLYELCTPVFAAPSAAAAAAAAPPPGAERCMCICVMCICHRYKI
jgi:hypothetical protein